MTTIHITLAQLNLTVGDLENNTDKIIHATNTAKQTQNAEIVIFPELATSGYVAEDLFLREDFLLDNERALKRICKEIPKDMLIIVGFPEKAHDHVFNSAAIIHQNKFLTIHRKQRLPNFGVFDEERYFNKGNTPCVFDYKNLKIGLTICEDLWHVEPAQLAKKAGAECLISINASPYYDKKIEKREREMALRVKETGLALLYVNHCCGQDDCLFDGSSFAMTNQGKIIAKAPFCKEALLPITIDTETKNPSSNTLIKAPNREEQLYTALVMGVQDYVRKNHFEKVLVGFSGGIDSSLTLVIAADALGKENVIPVILPSHFTSHLSLEAAHEQLIKMQMSYREFSIEDSYKAFLSTLSLNTSQTTITMQNIQARCRGIILMALSNELNAMLLNTSNKSEMAVGYGTLYGDMCGGYAVLKDVWKTDIYKLAKYRNTVSEVIPNTIINRAPTAELAEHQLDTDTLPDYAILDPILQRFIECDQSIAEIVDAGFDKKTVEYVVKLIKQNEYKRHQHAPGPKITQRAFVRERRYPITSGYPNLT